MVNFLRKEVTTEVIEIVLNNSSITQYNVRVRLNFHFIPELLKTLSEI